MAEESSDAEKTEPPSARRLDQAREEGQVPRSKELSAFLVLLSAALIFRMLGPWMAERMQTIVRKGFTFTPEQLSDAMFPMRRLAEFGIDAMLTFAPLVIAIVVSIFASPFLLGSWNFSSKAIMPDIGRFNIIKGLSRIISKQSFVELIKSIGKVSIVGGVAVYLMLDARPEIIAFSAEPLEVAIPKLGAMLSSHFLLLVLSMLIIVGLDVPYQLWQFYDKLKMTKDEAKQEYKQTEGSPEVKGKIRQMQREAAMRRMMSAVPQADVIVTNPTHFSIALVYKSGMQAPKLVAKGIGQTALKIREIAAEHGIPTLEAPPLARALYKHVDFDEEVPATLYAAVAEVLAYVYQLSTWKKEGGAYPSPPRYIDVPKDMVPELINGE